MTLDEAEALLQFPPRSTISHATIRRLYALRVKEAHPDTGMAQGATIEQLQQARDLLLEALESQKCACKLCQGRGQVRSGMAWRNCSACGGKGETQC